MISAARADPCPLSITGQRTGRKKGGNMEKDLAGMKPYLQDYASRTLEKSKSGLHNCPLCGSGTGPNRTGALGIFDEGQRWKCQSCQKGGDIFDLYAAVNNCSLSEATKAIIELYGDQPARPSNSAPGAPLTRRDLDRDAARLAGSPGETYLQGRGFTLDTMRRFKLGYNPDEYNKPLRKILPSIVIPYPGTDYYITRPISDKAYDKPKTSEAGKEPLFNLAALYTGGPVFIVESQLCAISIEQEGGAAVALGNSGKDRLIRQLQDKPTSAALILALDNDERGRKAQSELAAALELLGIPHIQANISGEYKDPNERLQHDAAGLRQAISAAIMEAEKARQAEALEAAAAYQQESAAGYIDQFFNGVTDSVNTPAIPTGFPGLDKLLEGGLYEGLYIIGAISSLGKTTYVLQMADQIAAAGHDVIVFSLEMARAELMAKSISRLTFKLTQQRRNAKTTRGITTGKRYAGYSDAEMQLIEKAREEYREKISPRVWIREGIGDLGVEQIRAAVERHINLTGRKPVIVIDYLQILAPYDIRATDKQNTDKAVLELKRISRDHKIPVIGISSFNRDNYTAPVNMAAFKESGAIEYSSDVLIGLQYQGMDYQEGEADGARQKRIRKLNKDNDIAAREGRGIEIELKVLKARNGGKGTSDPLTFYPMFNCFIEHPEGFTVVDDEPRRRRL
jgi:replicative DNA helicase